MKYLIFSIFAFILSSCDKKNPHPELLDEIYTDLVIELDLASKALASDTKALEDLLKERALVVPQTGQIKYMNKKVYAAEQQLVLLKQQIQYFEIKIEQRIASARTGYNESLKPGGKPWPNAAEAAMYKSVVKFQREKLLWDKNKGVKKDVPRGTENKK